MQQIQEHKRESSINPKPATIKSIVVPQGKESGVLGTSAGRRTIPLSPGGPTTAQASPSAFAIDSPAVAKRKQAEEGLRLRRSKIKLVLNEDIEQESLHSSEHHSEADEILNTMRAAQVAALAAVAQTASTKSNKKMQTYDSQGTRFRDS